jgi:glycosyltransferase involved in cell wall biosynthesis
MTSQPLVSILLTCYNFENYISLALQSLLNQTGNYSIEIIVFDDNSTDNSAKFIEQIKDDRIIFIHNQINKGATTCINQGFAMAKGKYICRFDGDDQWQPNFLATVIPIMEQNPDVGLLFGNYIPLDKNNNTAPPQKINRPSYLKTKDNDFKAILQQYYINAPTIIFRKIALDSIFPIPEKFGNFLDWYVSLSVLQNWKSYYHEEALAYYRIHDSNGHRKMIQNKTGEKITEMVLEQFVKNNDNLTTTEKNTIYATNYHLFAFKYLSENMEEDAKKYFKKTLFYNKKYLFDITFMRFFVVAYMGKENYEKFKKIVSVKVPLQIS